MKKNLILSGMFGVALMASGGAQAQDADKLLPIFGEIGKLQAKVEQLEKNYTALANRKIRLDACEYPPEFTHSGTGTNPAEVIQNAWNQYDQRVTAQCPREKVIVGLDSIHNNYFEDRMTKYLCCGLAFTN